MSLSAAPATATEIRYEVGVALLFAIVSVSTSADVAAIRLEAVRALAEERYLDLGEIGRRLHQAADVRDRAAATLRKHGIETESMETSR